MSITDQRVTHSVTVKFESRMTTDWKQRPVLASSLTINWRWGDGAWVQSYPKLVYRQVKKDGTPYAAAQDRLIYDSGEFADVIEATRPQYFPVLVDSAI